MAVQNKFNKYANDKIVREKCEQIVLACSIDTALKGGADKVLCRRAEVSAVRATAGDGQAAISGKLNVKAVYIDSEGALDSVDYVSDFSKTVACPSATDGATVLVFAKVVDVQAAVEGDSVKMQTVVELCPSVVVHNEYDLIEDADGAFLKRGSSSFCRLAGISDTECSVDEQYATGAVVEKVLAFDSDAAVCKVTEDGDGAIVEGEASVSLVYRSDGKAVQKNMTLPFVQRVEGKEGATYEVQAEVRDSKLVIGGSASENVFDVKVDVSIRTIVTERVEEQLVTDEYCPDKELKLSRLCTSFPHYVKTQCTRERINGSVESGSDDAGISRIVAAFTTENDVASTDFREDGANVEGVLAVCVIYLDDNDEYGSVSIDLPYSVTLQHCGEGADVRAESFDVSAKVKRDREIEVTATVCVSADCYETCTIEGIDGVEEGEVMKPCEDAISIYYAKHGDTLWEVAKKLSMAPEKIAEQNPSAGEVLEEGENIVVYREAAI